MNFTREPIIETVITPREGCKLAIRSSKATGQEDFYVDAIEVVSFGNSIFFRSTERPKSFLLPVSDYEVIELKETRMVLKSIGVERSIKIGSSPRPSEKPAPAAEVHEEAESSTPSPSPEKPNQPQDLGERKRDKRRSRRRRGGGMESKEGQQQTPKQSTDLLEPKADSSNEETPPPPPPSMISRLFPPPPTLIKEKLNRYKDTGVLEANLLPEKEKHPSDAINFGSEQKFFREEPKEGVLPEDLEPDLREPLDEPIYNPEHYEEENPKIKTEDKDIENPQGE